MFSIEAIPCLTALPLQARLGLLFSFSAYLRFLSTASLRVETHWFPLTLGWPLPPDSLTTGSHTSNRAGLGLGWCCFPTPPSDRPKTAAQGRVWVFSPKRAYPPPKGGGAGYRLSWVGPARSQLGHAGPTGLVWGFAGVVPLPGSQNRTQALTGPSLVFTVFFSHLFSSVIPLVAAPGDNSPPREWEGSYKAASRFSQCRPKSIRWWAAFR